VSSVKPQLFGTLQVCDSRALETTPLIEMGSVGEFYGKPPRACASRGFLEQARWTILLLGSLRLLTVSLAGLVTLGWMLTGEAAETAKHTIHLPTDWSHSHLIFSRPGTAA
jgi:hypothetical protein